MDLVSMFGKMRSGEFSAHSELGTRDEKKQTKNYGSRISKMKTATGINARAMVMKDTVIKFNPFTGRTDEVYNSDTPFRPILLPSQVLSGINVACAEDTQLKKFWEDQISARIPEGTPTMEEYYAFKARDFIQPRVHTFHTVSLNFGGIAGFPTFRSKYVVPSEDLNAGGNYEWDNAPVWEIMARFFYAMLKLEADEVEKSMKAAGQNNEAIQNQRKMIFSKSPVSTVMPTNLVPFLYFPLNEPIKNIDPDNHRDFEAYLRFYGYTDKWSVPMKEAMTDQDYDTVMDFFDFSIKTPSSTETKKNNQVYTDDDAFDIYNAMNISVTDSRKSLTDGSTVINGNSVPNTQLYAPVYTASQNYFAYSQNQSFTNGDTFEKIMAASNKCRPISAAMPNFLAACQQVFLTNFANTKYFTDDIKRGHEKAFVLLNPNNALLLAAEDDDDLKKANDAARMDAQAIVNEIKGSVQEGSLEAAGFNLMEFDEG